MSKPISYEITIVEKREVVKRVGKEWTVIGTREVARDALLNFDSKEPKTRIEDVRGYTPEIEKTVIEERQILKQVVDDIDMPTVIRAINSLTRD